MQYYREGGLFYKRLGFVPPATESTLNPHITAVCVRYEQYGVSSASQSFFLSLFFFFFFFLKRLCSVALQRLMYEAIARSNHFLSASNAGGEFMGKGAAEKNIVGSLGLLKMNASLPE